MTDKLGLPPYYVFLIYAYLYLTFVQTFFSVPSSLRKWDH